ncbi:DNA-processing protein DprA [Halobacillus sp. Marseille-Q1614]|uniref:DNA-processing protein DprA n=1 Tax=Halobacillus sp. Marseille-Q1614 TaxID=2709134 RepID=UPI00156EA989|nr:DNA-processing protein DprA [Halobacillus sp. Marseille-Q1614]
MISKREALITLNDCPYVTRPVLRQMMKDDSLLTSLPVLTPSKLSSKLSLPFKRSKSILDYIRNDNIMKKLDKNSRQFHALTIMDPDFPLSLRQIPDPPLVLYAKGNLELLSRLLSISVVGTRTPSDYAYYTMEKLLPPLISANFLIVSGMAAGVDQQAHQLAIDHGGATIAVLGSGFNYPYPKNNPALFQRLGETQLLLSEYPPDRPPKKYHFPERNRIISALTESTLVIEARMKSGSLITVDQALEQGKNVYAVPGPIGLETSEGCHHIIQQGAKLVQSCHDILQDYCLKK